MNFAVQYDQAFSLINVLGSAAIFTLKFFSSSKKYARGAEATLIYGPQNPIPRFVGVNVTLNVLGYSQCS